MGPADRSHLPRPSLQGLPVRRVGRGRREGHGQELLDGQRAHRQRRDAGSHREPRARRWRSCVQNVKLANPKRLPVIYAGDFNSHKNSYSDVVKSIMNRGKFYDAFDLARSLTNQHLNSYNDFKVAPRIGYKWGNHVDKVWIDPWQGRVDAWYNAALLDATGIHGQAHPLRPQPGRRRPENRLTGWSVHRRGAAVRPRIEATLSAPSRSPAVATRKKIVHRRAAAGRRLLIAFLSILVVAAVAGLPGRDVHRRRTSGRMPCGRRPARRPPRSRRPASSWTGRARPTPTRTSSRSATTAP